MLTQTKKWILLCTLTLISLTVCTNANGQNRAQNIETLFEALQLQEGKWIADIGSREGFFTIRMAPRVGDSGHIFAVDIDPDALENLHENLAESDITNVTPVYSVSDSPMLPPGVLDAILIRNTYHEFTEPLSMLSNIKRALKPNGRLVIAEPISDNLMDESRQRQKQSHDIAARFVKDDLQQSGFEIVEEMKEYSTNHQGTRMWLIVAKPSATD